MSGRDAFFEISSVSKVFSVKRRRGSGWFARTESVPLRAVDAVDLSVRRGQTVAIVGESGSGKSTLANMMARVTLPTEGRITLEGEDLAAACGARLRALRRRIQMVFQDPGSSLNPRQTVEDIIGLPLRLDGMRERRKRLARVKTLLEAVHLPADTVLRSPSSLSGGQKQRVNIARALALHPQLLLLDEPTSALDVSVQARILRLLVELRETHGLTYIIITHNLGVVRAVAERVVVMYLGQIVETGSVEDVMHRPRHPYTRTLVAAIPIVREQERALLPSAELIDGDAPSALDRPAHCAFYSRCPMRVDACRTQPAPPLQTGPDGIAVRCHRVDLKADEPAGPMLALAS